MVKNLETYDIFVVDSLNFLTKTRTLVKHGKLIILTLHPNVVPEDVIV